MTTGFYCVLIGPTAGPPAPRCWPRRASLVWACGRQNAPTGPSTRCQRLSVSRWPLRRSQKQKKETLGLWLSTCFVRTVGTTVTIHELMSLRMNLELMILLSFCITVAPLFCSGRHPYKVCPCDYSVCYFRVLFSWKCCRCNTSTGCTLLRFFSSSCFVIEFEEAGNIDCVSPSWLASTFLFCFFLQPITKPMKFRPWRQGNYERKALSRLDPALGMNYDVDARYIGSEEQGMCPADRRTRNLAIHRSHFRERARIKHTDSRTAINEGRDGGRFGIRAPGPCHWTGVGNGLHVRNGNFLDLVGSKKNISIHRAAATVAACDVLPSGREKEKANQSGEEGGGKRKIEMNP